MKQGQKFEPELLVVDSSFPSLNNDLKVVMDIKQSYDDLKTVLVGPPTSQFPDKILENKAIDFVARWEYDFTLKELVEALEENRDLDTIKGISYKANGKTIHNPDRGFTGSSDLDEIPFVSKVYKKHLNIRDYF